MSLFIQGSPAFAAINLPKHMAENITTMLWDIDNMLYHAATGLHDQIKAHIVADANVSDDLKVLRSRWASNGKISSAGELLPHDLGWAFPFIVDHYRQKGTQELTSYLRQIYDVDYSVIAPQPLLVAASLKWLGAGKRIIIYSNGPWSVAGEKELHVNKVLRRIGFSPNAFVEEDVVDLLKANRNPYFPKKFGCTEADTFRKATKEGFNRTAKALGFVPGSHVAFLDDCWPNLAATNVLRIHVATKKEDIANLLAAQNRDFVVWSKERDSKGRYLSSPGLLMEEVASFLPNGRPNHKVPVCWSRRGL